MRKRNCDKLFDNIMWYTIYLMPIIFMVAILATNFSGDWFATWAEYDGDFSSLPAIISIDGFINSILLHWSFAPIRDFLIEIWTLFEPTVPAEWNFTIYYFAYFITVYMFHLFVDFILFIPRLAHKWLNTAYQGD